MRWCTRGQTHCYYFFYSNSMLFIITERIWSPRNTDGSKLAREIVAGGDSPITVRCTIRLGPSRCTGTSSHKRGEIFHPAPDKVALWASPVRGFNLRITGLPPRVIETIQLHCALRMIRNGMCLSSGAHTLFPFSVLFAGVLCFLQELLDKIRAFPTVKVHLVAISACHVGIDKNTVSQHPLLGRFMKVLNRSVCGLERTLISAPI